MTAMMFKIYRDIDGEYRWTLYAANKKKIAASEGYKNKGDCKASCESIKEQASRAMILDVSRIKT